MTNRPHIPIRWVRKLLKQQGGWCAVPGCRCALEIYQGRRNFIVEHIVPRALLPAGRKDQFKNLELRCIPHAKEKTNGLKAKATARGTDNYEIKKTTRMRRKARHRVSHGRKPQSKWPQGRKLRGRGFAPQCKPLRSR